MIGAGAIRALGAVTVLFLTVAAFTRIPNMAGSALAVIPAVEPAGAIVVLGAGILEDGELRPDSIQRTVHGVELYKRGLAPLIIFSGQARPDSQVPSEPEARARLAEDMGVPPQAIVKIELANTTRQEAAGIADFLLSRDTRRILLVTESLHMRRAQKQHSPPRRGGVAAPIIQKTRSDRIGADRVVSSAKS